MNKVCKVHGELQEKDIYVRRHPGSDKVRQLECKICKKKAWQRNYEKDKERWKAKAKEWATNNKDKVRESQRKKRLVRPEYWLRNRKKCRQNETVNLAKSYVRRFFINSGLKTGDIPDQLVELKRVTILLKRKIKELKNGSNS
jgi:hypothetical protein